ncbi:MAG: N-6 DNA methylase [Nitrospinae bacterium]|nr:N-6 DNA methylase [Nitrospinota bacterium]
MLDNAQSVTLSGDSPDAPLFFQRLATGSFSLKGQVQTPDYVFEEIHRLLASADKELEGQMLPLEVLSVTGRALFFRFLHDRKIVVHEELADICPSADNLKDVFSDAERAAATSCWLDETFNGDFLPLVDSLDSSLSPVARMRAYRKFFRYAEEKTNGKVFRHLEAIMRGWKHVGGSSFQTTIDWDDFNFAHIPIGVLSQIYETFSRRWDVVQAEETSVHYTPKNIARLLVEEALAGVKEPQDALVLDPACGAGVFLVLAFRQLVRLHWKKMGRRPDKRVIHRILYNQIRGFDVSESALRLAALALYITAIEVNGTTRPPRILKFPRALQGEVLFNFGPHDTEERRYGFVLGSLAPNVPEHFNAKFDVVVGNPPWTRLRSRLTTSTEKAEQRVRNAATNQEFSAITRRILTTRQIMGIDVISYKNPDNNPDLPFLWRATEWAKPGGAIAMALPGRIILKQSGAGRLAREALFRGLTVSGILNGSDLEKTAVWPNMGLPFMLLFARNTVPPAKHQFSFITPVRENALCKRADFRFDFRAAQAVSVDSVVAKPWMLKTLSLGSVLDVEVIEKISSRELPSVSDVWTDLSSGEGYNVSSGLVQKPADHLLDLPNFEAPEYGFKIELQQLNSWQEHHHRMTAHAPRDAGLYNPPLVIVPQTPGQTRERPKAYLSEKHAIAFSKSFYGYSTAGHDNPKGLAQLLYLILHSQLWHHHYLTHSSRIGASYRTFLKEDLDSFSFPNPKTLTASKWHRVNRLAEELRSDKNKPWEAIDELVFELYGLNSHDMNVISDTVRFGAPYRSARLPAERPPQRSDVDAFCWYLVDMVQPFVKETCTELYAAEVIEQSEAWPWRFVTLTAHRAPVDISREFLSSVMQEANRTAASRIVMVLPQGGLFIGLLNQLRFWSQSRARLCGLHIVRQHLSAFRPI